jgi:hypothetical protein
MKYFCADGIHYHRDGSMVAVGVFLFPEDFEKLIGIDTGTTKPNPRSQPAIVKSMSFLLFLFGMAAVISVVLVVKTFRAFFP